MEQTYKRTREVPPEVRQKISASLRGRKKSFTHCQNISAGLKRMWDSIPKNDDDGTTTMDDIVL